MKQTTVTADEYKAMVRKGWSEKEFQGHVIDLLHRLDWVVAHFRAALTRDGRWITPVQADGKGFLDLVCIREERLIWIELKAETGRLTVDQKKWIDRLLKAKEEVYVFRPRDWDQIERILAR